MHDHCGSLPGGGPSPILQLVSACLQQAWLISSEALLRMAQELVQYVVQFPGHKLEQGPLMLKVPPWQMMKKGSNARFLSSLEAATPNAWQQGPSLPLI